MGHIWTSLAVFLLFFSGKALTQSNSDCYSFDTGTDGWTTPTGAAPGIWKWSGEILPDISNIPSFVIPDSNYMWFQDQSTPPLQGSMQSPETHTLYAGSTVQATIYRHIIIGQENDTDRPILRFVTGGSVQDIVYSYDYDQWSPISVTCGNIADWHLKKAVCCPGDNYPCTGHFQVDGQVLIRDELLGIDNIGINGGCSGSTPTAAPTESPSGWCCHFTSSGLCGWSPFYVTNGWVWSGSIPDPYISTFAPGPYIYIIDTSSAATSPTITVTDTSSFAFSYYFETAVVDYYNTLVASFTSNGRITNLSGYLPRTGDVFIRVSFTGVDLCNGLATCDGTFSLTTSNSPSISLVAAMTDFSVNGATC